MKKKRLWAAAVTGLAAIFIVSCSSLPQQKIDEANAAIEEAKAAGAELYLPEEYLVLEDSMRSILNNVEEQKSKFIKNFRTSEEHLAGLIQFAGEVKARTETRKMELTEEIRSTLEEVVSLIESNRQLILEAPRGKEGTSALMAIGNELNTIEATVAEAQSMLERGEYLTTLSVANSAREDATSINKELQDVIAKYKAGRRS